MPSSRAWIFQATPRTVDLAAELRGGEALSWVVTRYGRALRPGDRVYYWQAGRDAGIYGLGRVHDVSGRAADGRYTVRTVPALLAKSKAWDGYEDAAGPIKPAMKKLVEKL